MNTAQFLRNKLAERGIELLPSQCEDFIDLYQETSYETYMDLKEMEDEDFKEMTKCCDLSIEELKDIVQFSIYLCEIKFKNIQD